LFDRDQSEILIDPFWIIDMIPFGSFSGLGRISRRSEFLTLRMTMENTMLGTAKKEYPVDRRHFIGGSDARIIMGQDEKALIRLWQEKRGEVGPEDLSGNLIVQLGHPLPNPD
jgi:hypothetical protein